jgi:AP-3 complex subunit delta-1
MIGYDISWAAFSIIEVMSFTRFAHKQIGYLAANQSFNESTDLILLATNLFKKEFTSCSTNTQYEVGLALNSLSNIVTHELGRDCLSDIIGLINNSIPYLRKKAVLALYKLYIKYPGGLRLTFDLIKDRLDDNDSSVVSTAVSVICELANRNPRNYLALAPKFFKLLTTSSNNWLLIKLVKLFGLLVSEEPRLARKLIDPLVTLITNNTAKSLQFECVSTLTTAFLYTKKEDGTDAKNVPAAVKICSDHLRQFIVDTDQNLKYLGLVGLINLMQSHPRMVVEHRDIILLCLHDDDFTIRCKALELLAGIVSKKSLVDIVKHLLQHVASAKGEYRDEVIATILQICSKDKYALISDFAWYVSVLVQLATLTGTTQGCTICADLMDVTLRVKDIRAFAIHSLLPFLLERDLILSQSTEKSEPVIKTRY